MTSEALYPLTFHPIFKEKIWGGQKLKTLLNKDFGTLSNCGESWEISGVDGDLTVVSTGELEGATLPILIDRFKGELVGQKVYQQFGNKFPLLIKFIDANADLSIQVHPDDATAQRKHNSFGKSEMWYILQADQGARLISGFKDLVTKEEFRDFCKGGKVLEVLNREEVNEGDVYYLPSGRVHSIGAGLLLAEIQQTSDITYRVYDFDRVDDTGKKRDLHIEDALESVDFGVQSEYSSPYEQSPNSRVELVSCGYFTTNRLQLDKSFKWHHNLLDSFVIYMCTEGSGTINNVRIRKGESLLIPACLEEITIHPDQEIDLLESYIA